MTTSLYYNPFVPAYSNIGVPIAEAYLYFYYTSTSTLAPIFSDAAGTVPLTNPVQANLAGKYPAIYLQDGVTYRVHQTDKDGVTLGDDIDPYYPGTVSVTSDPSLRPDVDALSTATVAALRLIPYATLTNGRSSMVEGYYAAGDGGGGVFYWASASGLTDDGGNVINPTGNAGSGRWIRLKNDVDIRQFGAKLDAVTDDSVSVNKTITSLGSGGGKAIVPIGYSVVSDPGATGSCVLLTKATTLAGMGAGSSGIKPAPSITSSTDIVQFYPSTLFACDNSEISGMYFGDHTTGTRAGRTAIKLQTTVSGQNLNRLTIARNFIASGAGPGIHHVNDSVANVNGGMFCSNIADNVVGGGIKLENSGDSISILRNTLTGPFIGVNLALVAGASLTEIIGNNITNAGGTLRVDSGLRFKFWNNNTENFTAGAAAQNDSAAVNLTGTSGTIIGAELRSSLFAVYGASTATRVIRVGGARGTLISDNVFASGIGTCATAIVVDATATDTRIGPNTYNVGITTKVSDSGVGTMGVVKSLTLLNGWVDFAGGTLLPGFIKSPGDGLVHLWGKIKSGTLADGTVIANLPVGFRPSGTIEAPMMSNNAGTRSMGAITVDSAGDVKVYGAQTTACSFNLTFPALNLADAITYE